MSLLTKFSLMIFDDIFNIFANETFLQEKIGKIYKLFKILVTLKLLFSVRPIYTFPKLHIQHCIYCVEIQLWFVTTEIRIQIYDLYPICDLYADLRLVSDLWFVYRSVIRIQVCDLYQSYHAVIPIQGFIARCFVSKGSLQA